MPAAHGKELKHSVPHRGVPSFERLRGRRSPSPGSPVRAAFARTGVEIAAINSETLSGVHRSQEEEYLRASSVIQFRNCLTIVLFRERLHPGCYHRGTGLASGRRSGFLGFAIGFLPRSANIDAALEVSAIFNADALGDDISGQ